MAHQTASRADLLPVLGEIFREHGFQGTSLAIITARTTLGKGSLYHFFPGGKEEMAAAVLDEIDAWFACHVFAPLRDGDPRAAISATFAAVDAYFRSGRRMCLVGIFALDDTRDRFALKVRSYFQVWAEALASALCRLGVPAADARIRSEEALAAIQGALVLARALDDPDVFRRVLIRAENRLIE